MKNILIFIALLSFLFAASCKDESEKPKVSYSKTDKKVAEQKIDTAKILITGLPIQFETTNYLIYPIGNLNVSDSENKYDSSRNANDYPNFNIANNMDNEITGYITNLKFQKTDSDSLVSLTDKQLLIQSVNYLPTIAQKTRQQTLVYLLADADTNEDGKLDSNDIKSLYLSDISGTKFTKITSEFQEVLDWKIIDSRNRLYFRTIEDSNKNGKFDKNDTPHYGFVNLLDKDWKASEFKN